MIVQSGTATIALGAQTLTLANLAGPIAFPAQTGTISDLAIGGTLGNLTGGTGELSLPGGTATLAGGTGDGTLAPSSVTFPSLPLPAIVPVPVDLTTPAPMSLRATVPLTLAEPSAATRFGLRFTAGDVRVGVPAWPPAPFAEGLRTRLQLAVQQIVHQLSLQLGIPSLTTPEVNAATVSALIGPIPVLVAAALEEALSGLTAETGRLIFPAASTGASCDVRSLPTSATAALNVTAGGTYVLQIGFERTGSSDIQAIPPPSPGIECEVLVGNSFLLGLICCLVERLPAFSLPNPATIGTTDVAGAGHTRCCNFTGVTANFAGASVGGGGISVCIDGASGGDKTFSIVGRFVQDVPSGVPLFTTIANVTASFTLPLAFDFDDAASLANLRLGRPPEVRAEVTVSLSFAALILIIAVVAGVAGGLIAGAVALVMAPVAAMIVFLMLVIGCGAATYILRNAVRTLLSGASLLRSPVSLPPGLLEAFGKLSPVTVTVDDLQARGVLHTPTSVWGLLPRIGPRRIVPGLRIPDGFVVQVPNLVIGATGTAVPGVATGLTGGQTGPTGPGAVGIAGVSGAGTRTPPLRGGWPGQDRPSKSSAEQDDDDGTPPE
ncbi:MAG TPA: hypothetical protein VEW25_05205 [Allosphingosinicella sp.]|nr:hypothetical protein [Allosphingosinicella sp.]